MPIDQGRLIDCADRCFESNVDPALQTRLQEVGGHPAQAARGPQWCLRPQTVPRRGQAERRCSARARADGPSSRTRRTDSRRAPAERHWPCRPVPCGMSCAPRGPAATRSAVEVHNDRREPSRRTRTGQWGQKFSCRGIDHRHGLFPRHAVKVIEEGLKFMVRRGILKQHPHRHPRSAEDGLPAKSFCADRHVRVQRAAGGNVLPARCHPDRR